VGPARVLDSSTRTAPEWRNDHPVTRLTQALLEEVIRTHNTQLPASFDIAPGELHVFSVDFGRIVAGFVEPAFRRTCAALVHQYLDERGTLADVPEWNLVDWASIFVSGRSSILTALWARSLIEFAELSHAIGNAGSAHWARGLYDSATSGFEDFWDPDRGLYVDHIVAGQRQPAASQVAQASAIVSGLAPRERWSPLVDAMTDSDRLVVRSWVGSDTGGYDHERFAQQIRGLPPIDWDPEREMVIAEPFFSYAVHDAVARAGRAELLIDLVRRWEEFLVDGYDAFGECWGWGTPVHGWSSTPTRDLIW
jgi:alpha-L-rhamnosidase